MSIKTIQATQPNPAEDYDSPNGYLYGHAYWSTDGAYGIAKHKTPEALFQAGAQVEWEQVREFKGVAQIKLQKPGFAPGGAPAQRPPASAAPAARAPAAPAQEAPRFLGVTIGAALNNACLLLCHGVERINPEGETLEKALWRVASGVLKVSEALQAGKIHGEARKAPAQPQAAPSAPAPPPAPPAQQASQQRAPSMRGHQAHVNENGDNLAFDPSAFEEDVPF